MRIPLGSLPEAVFIADKAGPPAIVAVIGAGYDQEVRMDLVTSRPSLHEWRTLLELSPGDCLGLRLDNRNYQLVATARPDGTWLRVYTNSHFDGEVEVKLSEGDVRRVAGIVEWLEERERWAKTAGSDRSTWW